MHQQFEQPADDDDQLVQLGGASQGRRLVQHRLGGAVHRFDQQRQRNTVGRVPLGDRRDERRHLGSGELPLFADGLQDGSAARVDRGQHLGGEMSFRQIRRGRGGAESGGQHAFGDLRPAGEQPGHQCGAIGRRRKDGGHVPIVSNDRFARQDNRHIERNFGARNNLAARLFSPTCSDIAAATAIDSITPPI
ncbi:hypothetical protein NBRGN_046_00140 [Nocardia brasiliensis NBRC 14402]|uniref:hypothetical protein n=1 Tax=Nocardia brasiliensis TaxID=37326 RepID=UPI00045C75F6|nr:hypothetical protein [Nocardia brasiliensis]GAJ82049.1 hypothetical protein NBRGN_046_00140 [Nocardia brasiliensis NBRC 14402]